MSSKQRVDGESGGVVKALVRRVGALVRSPLVRNGSFGFIVATGAVSASNFLFHAVISRLIGPANYGVLGSILNLLLVLSVPLGALQVAATRVTVEWEERGAPAAGLRRIVVQVGIAGLVATAGVDLCAPWLARYLHMANAESVYILSAWLLPAVLAAVFQGVLMGQRRFGPVAAANVVGGGVIRVVVGVALVLAGFGVPGAVAASVVAQLVTLLLLLPTAVPSLVRASGHVSYASIAFGDGVRTVLALGGYWVLTSMDTVMARHYLPPTSAGLYASAATLGRIALFLPGAIALLALPRFAAAKGLGQEARDALRWSIPATLGLSFAASAVIGVFPALLVRVLFGAAFVAAAPVVRILGVEAAALGLTGLLIYYLLARRSRLAYLAWAGAALAWLTISVFHGSGTSIAFVMLACASGVAISMFVGATSYLISHPLCPDSASRHAVAKDRDPSAPDEVDLSVVVPFYNPGAALTSHIADLAETLERAGVAYELIAVSDGSTDGSLEELLARADAIGPLEVIDLHENCGKGQALRVGLTRGRGRYVGFIDADGDIPAFELDKLLAGIKGASPDVVTGSKRHPDSNVVYPPIRRLYSWGYQQVLRALFDLSVQDTQTGVKLIRRDVLEKVLPRMVEKRFAFDVEMFAVAQRLGFSDFLEVPVMIRERISTTISVKAVWRIFVDTAAIFYRLRIVHYYDDPLPPKPQLLVGSEA